MPDKLTCPVCERSGVPAESESCPQCDADLTCFQALKTLSANKVAASPREPTTGRQAKGVAGSRRAVLLLLLLLVLLAALFSLYVLKAQDHTSDLKQQVVALTTDLQLVEEKVEQTKQALCVLPESERVGAIEEESFEEDDPLIYAEDLAAEASLEKEGEIGQEQEKEHEKEGQVAAGSAQDNREKEAGTGVEGEVGKTTKTPDIERTASTVSVSVVEVVAKKKKLVQIAEERWSDKTFLYLVKETDTLWGLAERFYGDGKYYPVIMEQNPGLIISDIQDEESLRLITDRAMLKDMYSRRIEWHDGMMLWKHTVRTGETRQTIKKRFAPPGVADRVLYKKNPFIQPGAVVRVILQ